ncbi:MAG TPA: hypothetical protein DDX98_12795 [Bacteroidales bacterium]|jgi:uncharacterized membrane protein HdeD (DUF308 family)|nr:hypothetical protein [Bacteroidales bacterium]
MNILKNKNWLFSSMGGVLAILFGIIAIVFPSITLIGLAYYFAAAILVGGIFLTIVAIRLKETNPGWTFLLLEGIIGILVGLFIVFRPTLSAAIFVTVIGVWALLLGLFFLIIYFKRNRLKMERNFMLFIGILSLLFGLIITINPFEGTRFITILIGLYAIAYGVFSLVNHRKTMRTVE